MLLVMDVGGIAAGVGKTALGVAMVRAEESRRADRLFDDPYAQAFLAAAPGVFDAERESARSREEGMADWGAAFWSHAVIRTRFFDDYLLRVVGDGCRQVAILAAGLDARAYRLAWPAGVRLFELDMSAVLDFKDRVLGELAAVPRCTRVPVAVDLGGAWAEPLVTAGFDRSQRTAWLAEGLLVYLSAAEAARMLSTIAALSAAGSRLALEHETLGDEVMRRDAGKMPTMRQYAGLWKGGLPDAPGWLAAHGWEPRSHDRAAVAASVGRAAPRSSGGGYLTATRR